MATLTLNQLARITATQGAWMDYPPDKPYSLIPPTARQLASGIFKRISNPNPPGVFQHELIVGARQVGKSTLLKHVALKMLQAGSVPPEKIIYLSLDTPIFNGVALTEILGLLCEMTEATVERPCYLLADEITYCDYWDRGLKLAYDLPHTYPVKIIATSSSAWDMNRNIDSGPGRWKPSYMFPCQISEYCDLAGEPIPTQGFAGDTLKSMLDSIPEGCQTLPDNRAKMENFCVFGGFPSRNPLTTSATDDALVTQHYEKVHETVMKAIRHDIVAAVRPTDPKKIMDLFIRLCENPTGVFSAAKLSQELGIDKKTVEKWADSFQNTMLTFRLYNFQSRMKGRKTFFCDNSIPAMLTFQTRQDLLGGKRGWAWENMVGAALFELTEHSKFRFKLAHLRKQIGTAPREIDFVISEMPDNAPIAIEIGSSLNHDLKSLRHLIDAFPSLRGNAYLVTPDAPANRDGEIKTLPLFEFLLAVEYLKNQITG